MTQIANDPLAEKAARPMIRCEGVSKRYLRDGHRPSLRHEALRILKGRPSEEGGDRAAFWALKDVSFSVQAGESVGIVGRNGAGKTTLLRVLAGITEPTQGEVEVRGRFATLIALGAGFNPERTGRENIYLNAAIQGVPPREVDQVMGDIIAFSELGPFIDTAVKRYSSGMAARLGFSIAVHILPDVIFLDEVLAVGDAAFQEKCIARMLAIRQQHPRTLMFVSHDASVVQLLCERCLWLHEGRLIMDGPAGKVLAAYEESWQRGAGGETEQTNPP